MREIISAFSGFDGITRKLTSIYCQEHISRQELGAWFESVDFEALIPQISCMAALTGEQIQFDGVPEKLTPRLRGIIRYIHTLNSGMIAGACALGAKMNEAGIPMLLMDDTALYMRYPDAPQRHLWQMTVAVRKQDFRQAIKIASDAGFLVEELALCAIARQGVTRQIVIIPLRDTASQWRNTTELKKGKVTFRCPVPAAILLEVSQRAFRALTKPNSRAAIACWIMDMRVLLSRLQETDWKQAIQLAVNDNASSHMQLMLTLYGTETGRHIEDKALFATESEANQLAQLLEQFRAMPEKGNRIHRLVLSCRLRRPDSLYHTGRLCVKEALWIIRNRLTRGN